MNKDFIKEQIYDEDYADRLKRLIEIFNKGIDGQFDVKRIFSIASNSVNSVYKYNELGWISRLTGFGIDLKKDVSYKFLSKFLKMRIDNNVEIIKNLKEDVASSLAKTIYSNFEKGKTITELSKDISARFGIDKRRAVLIARNEIKNTNTMLNKKRMQEYGIEKAEWMTADDERVRSQHKKFDGKIYEVGKGLKNELGKYEEPGQAINCRCVAIPII